MRATSQIILGWVAGMCFFSLAYNLILYASLNQGVDLNLTSNSRFTVREMSVLTRIIAPAIIIVIRAQQ